MSPIAFAGLIKRHMEQEPDRGLQLFYDGAGNLMDQPGEYPFIVEPGTPDDIKDIVRKAGAGHWLVAPESSMGSKTAILILIYPRRWGSRPLLWNSAICGAYRYERQTLRPKPQEDIAPSLFGLV